MGLAKRHVDSTDVLLHQCGDRLPCGSQLVLDLMKLFANALHVLGKLSNFLLEYACELFNLSKIGCDAVMLPALLGSEAKDHWGSWNDPDTDQLHQYDSKSVLSSVQVLILDLEGNLLMNGQASGESYLQTDQTLFAETQIDKIMRKALQ